MNASFQRYYKRQIYGGRSTLGRILDFVVFRAMLLFVIFLVMLQASRSLTVAILIAVFVTAAISLALTLLKRRREEKFLAKDMVRIQRKCLLESLTLMSFSEFQEYIAKLFDGQIEDIKPIVGGFRGKYKDMVLFALHNHPSAKCSVDEVLGIYRHGKNSKRIILVSLSDMEDEAHKMCKRMPCEMVLVCGDAVLDLAAKKEMLPDEQSAMEKAEKEMKETIVTLKQVKKHALSKVKIKGYVLCGIAVMLWPLVTGFRFYYPIITVICFVLAIVTYKKSRAAEESSGMPIS